ncbi:hypothetical protein L9F63_022783, partial [Diploptera punctata]
MPWKCFMNCVRSQAEDVRQLDYQHSMLQDVPPEVFAYERTLEELNLDSNRHIDRSRNGSVNQLEKLPEGFTQLLSLEELYLNDTCLDFLPANFGRLTKLRILELRENNLNTLPKSIARLTSLERMDIGQNEFSDLPEVIGRLVNLTELWVDCNRIRGVPKLIGNLKKLMHFDASTNNINWVAPEIGSCSSLTDLTLSCNEITEIPETIGNLKMLVTLKLDDNQLTTLPSTIGKLSNLEELILSQNDFETLSPYVGLLRKLNTLNIDDNMLEELPCTSLTILSVRSNKLQEVPAELGHLPKIRVMNLSDNQLRNLPVSILNLTYLTALWLSNNQSTPLTTLQQEVDKVTGQTVCVNFMLPQSSQELYLAENVNDMKSEVKCSSRQTDKSSERPHIRFAPDADSEMTGHLVRAPTPYPKELRAMAKHARSFQQQHTRRVPRQSESEVPLLGEMVSPGPKGVLIKEAKVKKPSTVPLGQPAGSKRNIGNEEICDQMPETPVSTNKHESIKTSTDENTPVLASGGGPVIREAKCVRQATSISDEREKFFNQKEGTASPVPSVDVVDAARSRYSITSEPPPYHIAAAYSKQAAYFQVRSSPAASLLSQKPASPVVHHAEVPVATEQKTSDEKVFIPSAASSKLLPDNTISGDNFKKSVEEKQESLGNNWQMKIESSLPFKQKAEEIENISESPKAISHEVQIAELQENNKRSATNNELLNEMERESIIVEDSFSNHIVSEAKVVENTELTQKMYNNIEIPILKEPSTPVSLPPLTPPVNSTSTTTVTNDNSTEIVTITLTNEEQNEKEVRPTSSPSSVESIKQPSLSPKCRIPVRLGEPLLQKSPTLDNELLVKPSTFTQDKPPIDHSIFAPTPQRPGTSSPAPITASPPKYLSTPKSPPSASRAGSKIPSLLPSAIHGIGKPDMKQLRNNSPSPKPEKTLPESKYINTSVISNHNKSVSSNNWPSAGSDQESLSDSLSTTRIPQPGFYSNSPHTYQSSKRSSVSSQSSSSSRPGSIAPLNTSLDSSSSPISKEASYNYLNKPRFSSTDHNLNISSRIPTATSPPLSSHINPISGFSSGYESESMHANSRSSISNDHSPLVSKIPTLASSPVSPTSRIGNLQQQKLFSPNSSDSSSVRSSLESPVRQTKTWMFGPHKNATV